MSTPMRVRLPSANIASISARAEDESMLMVIPRRGFDMLLQQEAKMVHVVARATAGDFFTFVVHRGKLQGFQMMFQQDGALGFLWLHGHAPTRKDW